jgi:hypothetical protein
MSNVNLTVDWIGNEALRLAHEKLSFLGTVNREFDSSFRPGYGNSIRIRIPSQYTTRTGRVMDVQDGVQQSTQLTVATQWGVDLRYNSQEMAQDLVNFQRLHLDPAMAELTAMVENACISSATQQTYNVVGLPGSAITTLRYLGEARGRLNQYLAPKTGGGRAVQLDSMLMARLVDSFSGFNNPTSEISEQYREGFIARNAMADFYENEKVWNMANMTGGVSSWVDTINFANGLNALTVSTAGGTYNAGMTFTIGHTTSMANRVMACHPETKAPYPHQQTFTILTVSTATGFTFSPPIYISGARQNVVRASGAAFAAGDLSSAALVGTGGPASTYPQPLMYHRDAFTFATAALPLMDDAIRCVVKTYDGISLRVWEGSDIRNDEKLTRIDILWGFAAIRPQWACRLIGSNL